MFTSKSQAEYDDVVDGGGDGAGDVGDHSERFYHSETQSITGLGTFSLYPTLRRPNPKKSAPKGKPAGFVLQIQSCIYKFLNQPSSVLAIVYHLTVMMVLLVYTGLFLLTERQEWHTKCHHRFPIHSPRHEPRFLFETILIIYNLTEFLLRLWSSRSLPVYRRVPMARWLLSYLSRLSHIFDVLLIIASVVLLPCYVPIPRDVTYLVLSLVVLRAFHRLFNVAQWTSVHLRESPWRLMLEVFREQGAILLGVFYLEILLVCLMAYSVFVVENWTVVQRQEHMAAAATANDTARLTNMVDALYWSSITLATIGYGDYYPASYVSKLITFISLMISLSLYSLPSGIIATSLALKINAKEEIEKRKGERHLAALLIQTVWRLQRREKRFHLAVLLWARVQQQSNTTAAAVAAGHEARSKTKKKARIAKRLKAKVDRIMAKRAEFYAYRFIQMTRIQVLLRRFETTTDHSIRASIQCHWMEHRELTALLDSVRFELDRKAVVVESDGCEDDAAEDDIEMIHKLQNLESRLAHLNSLATKQGAVLRKRFGK